MEPRSVVASLLLVLALVPVESIELKCTLVSPSDEFRGHFGKAVSTAGDVDNDGCDDVIVGAPDEDPGAGPDDAGR